LSGIQEATHYPLPYQIGGVSVSLNGDPAPLLAVANLGEYQQINIQMPTGGGGTLEVSQSGNTGNIQAFPGFDWGAFFTDPSGHAIVQHADYSPVTPDHPAQPGEVVAAYGTKSDRLQHRRGQRSTVGLPFPP
jgi:uncharacterized protein (TIGR03437 family)